ncbi:sugar ABC transporter substrate-binding protein [Halalkalibacterium halodurans]|uniref:Rhizopine ABC transporter (Rhizopine-binding protein) n=1 Tax=Halalkalibacterium halodurans (strain ATCC BAA-125 / DSM 18197 / FERM 7344 / JCM 9153 / C-125) TaxID=272558 RepID=Q9K631_HALH5|nr:sugar ABC transporter substrate-binding protein [Halalkalibacterium halodurans]MDY7224404.1 sugar ABC transporter substrate-binding protein [Halalkalibacterium halodurans]MDY7243689.1 sugar ABC transporter substrate-binding protein [Halalkalibacterium halodurans]MED4079609.1 sugar ABC transporter substrate-binding protein [Halalkalibacterium halodurans]MED4084114.1 sugar ABC transporter substrate-binding protein [Halalkalibacterium halodurans]MED4104592.1 sugar ABC transporter substrate-bin
MFGLNKKVAVALIIYCLSFLLVGCASDSDEQMGTESVNKAGDDGKMVIGFAHPDFNDMFLGFLLAGVQAYEAEQTNVEVVYVDAENDSDGQIAQVEDLIAQGVDAIMAIPVDLIATEFIVDRAQQAGVPVVLINRDSVEREDAYVGSDSLQAGTIQMEEVAAVLKGKGKIAIMNGQMGHTAQINRTLGNKQVVDQYPGMEVVIEGTGGWSREKGKELMESWIESGQTFDAVVANNDEMAIGAIMAAEEAGIVDELVFAGIDGTPDALDYMSKGKLTISVFQDAKGQGQTGLEQAIKLAKGESAEKMTNIPYETITKRNVDEYKKKWQ